jgi:hypothetical protein
MPQKVETGCRNRFLDCSMLQLKQEVKKDCWNDNGDEEKQFN